jgi:hypothetical protein
MSPYVLRGLLTEDGEIDYSEHWMYGYLPEVGRFVAALVESVVDGEWVDGEWVPFHDPNVPIEVYEVDTIEELEETITGGEIPAEVVTALREEQQRHLASRAAARGAAAS